MAEELRLHHKDAAREARGLGPLDGLPNGTPGVETGPAPAP